jgi:NADH-quinone oxidoreductase subunit L
MFVRRPGITLWLRDRYRPVHDFLEHKWYFDELYDAAVVRPVLAFGRFGQTVVETRFVQGVVIGGATSTVRGATSFARAIQSGYLRAYAALLLVGLSGLALYFLLQSS